MITINKMPHEILFQIFSKLDKSSLFNATMTCRKWMNEILPSLPSLVHLHVELNSLSCNSFILYKKNIFNIKVLFDFFF